VITGMVTLEELERLNAPHAVLTMARQNGGAVVARINDDDTVDFAISDEELDAMETNATANATYETESHGEWRKSLTN
jgi:hypothetical protein